MLKHITSSGNDLSYDDKTWRAKYLDARAKYLDADNSVSAKKNFFEGCRVVPVDSHIIYIYIYVYIYRSLFRKIFIDYATKLGRLHAYLI